MGVRDWGRLYLLWWLGDSNVEIGLGYMGEDSDVLLRSRCFGVYVDLEDSTCTVVDRLSALTNSSHSFSQHHNHHHQFYSSVLLTLLR
jgi:hypothetical protein